MTAKLLNGKINEHGVIIPFNDTMDTIYNNAGDSLLYHVYESGKVRAEINLAEFDDGQAACCASIRVSSMGSSSPMTMDDKKDRETAIQEKKDRIVAFLKGIIESDDHNKTKSTDRECKKVLEQIYYDNPVYKPEVQAEKKESPLTLPLDF